LRVCFISWEYPTHTGFGGIAFYVRAIAKLLAIEGHSIHIITSALNIKNAYSIKDAELDINIHYLNSITHGIFTRKVEGKLIELTAANKFDIIEVADYGADAYLVLNNIKNFTYKFHVRIHSPGFLQAYMNQNHFSGKIKIFLILFISKYNLTYVVFCKILNNWSSGLAANRRELISARKADIITAPSRTCFDFLSFYWNIDTDKILINNNPSTLKFKDKPNFKNFSKKLSIGFVGRCIYVKGFDIFINAIEKLISEFLFTFQIQLEVNIIGEIHDDLKSDVQNRLNKSKNLNLLIHGLKDSDYVEKLIEAMDIVIIPSRYDNFPNVHIEAMAKGCIVLSSNKTGTSKLIKHGKNGFVFKNENEIVKILLNIIDLESEEINIISKNSIQTIKDEFECSNVLKNYY